MTYSLSLAKQTQNFFAAFGFGFILGILYDFFFVIRSLISKRKAATFICDLAFVVLAALMSFMLLLVITDGQLRFYVLAGELLGFFVYYLSFGVFVIRISEKIIAFIRKICLKLKRLLVSVFRIISYPFRAIFSVFCKIFKKIRIFLRKTLKKTLKKVKYHLRFENNMLYNQKVYRGSLPQNPKKHTKGRVRHSGKQKVKKE
jgi:spore cortex biosynthesis protein YabQ